MQIIINDTDLIKLKPATRQDLLATLANLAFLELDVAARKVRNANHTNVERIEKEAYR